ncbi:AAA family ATPase [Sorangium sp. So ce542]|uniref:AAA family ATPase n=1 Tax=Sorangium sp. So ce542 TaxID=3133316 RepID=UPI003F61D548
MSLRVALGIDDFRQLRESGLEYVDKTHLIRELIDKEGVQVALLPRPRRFGKTLNLSMLRWFFEKRQEDLSRLFEDLSIWQAGERYRAHFQRYPVIYLTLKGAKQETFERCFAALREKIVALYDQHRYVLDSGQLGDVEQRRYREVLDGTASEAVYGRALLDLSSHLHRLHGERVVMLIDEYDEPIHAGYLHGYAPRILDFVRTFLTEGLKGNPHLHRAVLTGILRVARESIFSGLNNVVVYSLLRSDFGTCFGFTEPEVEALLDKAGRRSLLEVIRAWYNGYDFGGAVIYNPWSILSFLEGRDADPLPFWLGTSSNDLIQRVIEEHAVTLQPALEVLMEGGEIERVLEENVAVGDLAQNEDALFGLLVFSGYLRAEKRSRGPGEQPAHALKIPNREVRLLYTSTFRRWAEARLKRQGTSMQRLLAALLSGDAAGFETELQAFVTDVLSYHDATRVDPEAVYHGFVAGLLAAIEPGHHVRANRESGQGRPDVMIRPAQPGRPGVVLELKVARAPRASLDRALDEALAQSRTRGYAAELRASGAVPVHALAVAFDGKVVRVRAGEPG